VRHKSKISINNTSLPSTRIFLRVQQSFSTFVSLHPTTGAAQPDMQFLRPLRKLRRGFKSHSWRRCLSAFPAVFLLPRAASALWWSELLATYPEMPGSMRSLVNKNSLIWRC
jgi:hypothetical protein